MHPESRLSDGNDPVSLANAWLETSINLRPESLTTVETHDRKEASEYARIFARHYNELVGLADADALGRLHDGVDPRGTGPFILRFLQERGSKTLIDTCGGCQYDSIFLSGAAGRGECDLQSIVSNELDDALFEQGRKNLQTVRSQKNLLEPTCTRHPWQELGAHFSQAQFDASLCMGNSFAHLSDKNQRRLSLANMAQVTRDVFLVDSRNFDQMLAAREALRVQTRDMLRSGHFIAGNTALFPGSIANFPVYISEEKVIVAYVKSGESSPYAFVTFHPLPLEDLISEAQEFFGRVDVYYDREHRDLSSAEVADLRGPSTIQLICTDPKHAHAEQVIRM